MFFGLFYDEFLLDTDVCIAFDKHTTKNEKVKKSTYDFEHGKQFEDLYHV